MAAGGQNFLFNSLREIPERSRKQPEFNLFFLKMYFSSAFNFEHFMPGVKNLKMDRKYFFGAKLFENPRFPP